MKKMIILIAVIIFTASCKKEIIETRTGNLQYVFNSEELVGSTTYPKIRIGTQVWMKKNLNTKVYRNGDSIQFVRKPIKWDSTNKGAYCYYNGDNHNGEIYGKLYNWYAVNDKRGLAPVGWHIPTEKEIQILAAYFGGGAVAGGPLKSTNGWAFPNTGASNSSGFSALPGGQRGIAFGEYADLLNYGYWWTINGNGAKNALAAKLSFNNAELELDFKDKNCGFSVRCIRDSL